MQGKIALEEHIAIEETSNNFGTPFPDKVWNELKGRLLDIQDQRLAADGQARHRNDDPVLECARRTGHPRDGKRRRDRQTRQRLSCRAGAPASVALPGLCGAADAGPGACDRELERCVKTLGFPRRAGQWIFASLRCDQAQSTTTCRNTGRSGKGRAARRSLLSASAQSAA